MRQIGLFLLGGLALLIIGLSTALNFFNSAEPAQGPIIIPVDQTITHLETNLVAEQAASQAQVAALEQTLTHRQTELPRRREDLDAQITAARQTLSDLLEQKQGLQERLDQYKAMRVEQVTAHQTELEAIRAEYTRRQAQLQAAQARLIDLNTQLER